MAILVSLFIHYRAPNPPQAHYHAFQFSRAQEVTIRQGADWIYNSTITESDSPDGPVKGLLAAAGNLTVETVGLFYRKRGIN